MKCPVCTESDLVMSDRHGVEIDYCPRCRGVWLDRGELDKIIDRADRDNDGPRRDDRYRDDPDRKPEHYQHKKKSFWHELFD